MVLFNKLSGIIFTNVSKAEASRRIGISDKQISRWVDKQNPYEEFNHFILYFNEVELKQNKGFRLK